MNTAWKHKRDLIERLREFDKLSNAEQVEARIAWLEWKMVEVLWLAISVSSFLAGGGSPWLLVPVFLLVWLVAGWRLERHTFRGAPPRINFVDP
jgi:hypothetical protein